MVINRIALTSEGAAMLVSTSAEDLVACPHCGVDIVLEKLEPEPGCLAVACPSCDQRSLLVRLVSVLHRAVRWPGELLAQLQDKEAEGRASESALRMPDEVFTLSVSRGAMALLAMLWQEAVRTGSTTIESSVSRLAQRLLSSRGVVRTWLIELEHAGVLQELLDDGKRRRPRQWELLPLAGEGGDG